MHGGSHFWQVWAFNGVSLCICQCLCSSGSLSHCSSLWSDQCCVSLQCSNHWDTSQTLLHPEKPQQPSCKHMSIIPDCRFTSKCRRSCTQREETKNTSASFFPPCMTCLNKSSNNCLVCQSSCCLGCFLEAPLTDTLHSVEMRLELLIRPLGKCWSCAYVGTSVLQRHKSSRSQFAKFLPVIGLMSTRQSLSF